MNIRIHNRMPVILSREMIREWLKPENDAEKMQEKAELKVRFEQVG